MIFKRADDKAPDIAALQRLLGRTDLSNYQRQQVSQQIANIERGERGERGVAYLLDYSLFDAKNTIVIHDLRIEVDGRVAQIDHLVISRYRLAYVLETKNLNAKLHCNARGEWTAWYGAGRNGTPRAIPSPIEQARRQVEVLNAWFKQNGWSTIKRTDAVVVVPTTTCVDDKRARGDRGVAIVRADLFRHWWENDRDIGSFFSTPWLFASRYSTEQLAELGRHLAASHRPISRDWAARFGIGSDNAPTRSNPARSVPPVGTDQLKPVARSGPHLRLVTADDSTFQRTAIATPFGIVTVRRVTDGRYALRHERDDRLLEHVRKIASEHGSWQPRFKNWLIAPAEIESVAARLAASG